MKMSTALKEKCSAWSDAHPLPDRYCWKLDRYQPGGAGNIYYRLEIMDRGHARYGGYGLTLHPFGSERFDHAEMLAFLSALMWGQHNFDDAIAEHEERLAWAYWLKRRAPLTNAEWDKCRNQFLSPYIVVTHHGVCGVVYDAADTLAQALELAHSYGSDHLRLFRRAQEWEHSNVVESPMRIQ